MDMTNGKAPRPKITLTVLPAVRRKAMERGPIQRPTFMITVPPDVRRRAMERLNGTSRLPSSVNPNSGINARGRGTSSALPQEGIVDEKALRRTGDVMQTLQQARANLKQAAGLQTKVREKQRLGVAQCYEAACILVERDLAWKKFRDQLANELEVRTTDKSREEALRLVLLYAVGETTKGARQQVSLFHRAIRPLFDRRIPARAVPARVKAGGGFRKMAAANAKKRKPEDNGSTNEPAKASRKGSAATTLMIKAVLEDEGDQLLGFPVSAKVRFEAVIDSTRKDGFALTIFKAAQIGNE